MLRNTLLLALAFGTTIALAQQRPATLPATVHERLLKNGFLQEDLDGLVQRDHYRTAHNGLQHTYLRQRWQGVEIWNGDIAIHTDAGGSVVRLNNGLYDHLAKRVNATTPVVTPDAALGLALAREKGLPVPARTGSDADLNEFVYDGTAFSGEPVRVRLVLQPAGDRLLLAWNVNYYLPDGAHWWNTRIDAIDGKELGRNDWVSNCGFDKAARTAMENAPDDAPPAPAAANDLNVYPWPVESPIHGGRAIRNAPWTDGGLASPYGWNDTNGSPGAESTFTVGNNVIAQEDANGNNGTGVRADGGADLDFDFSINLTQSPSNYQNAALTNLYYWNNIMHDVWYQYGFDEPAGNFQLNNYGHGGNGNDHVLADGQDGSGLNNANFATPADGSNPRMQMYLWNQTSPNRDGDLDNGIIAHEYTHGISNRLVGGPSNVDCLWNAEQMGEGWSDWFGLMVTMEPGDQGTDARGIGTYVLGEPVTGLGIRPAPYTTNMGVNAYTYASTNSMSEVHDIGFVWCSILWELTWALVDEYGFDPDIYNGTGGNNIAMRLVTDGLKLTPCSPGFVDGRDAILEADMQDFGGANQILIWTAFAKRGLGSGASQGSSNSTSDQTASFSIPVPNDLSVLAVIAPAAGNLFACNDEPHTVIADVRNLGTAAQFDVPVSYRLDNGPIVTEVWAGSIISGAQTDFTFSTPVVISGLGPHTLRVFAGLTGDQVASNDTATVVINLTTGTTVGVPFQESVTLDTTLPTGWTLENPDNSSYTWDTKNATGITGSTTATWWINNYSYNGNGQEDRLMTPIIDLGGSAGTHLVFDHAYAAYNSTYYDGMRVDISGDCGGSWTTLWTATGQDLATRTNTTSAWTPTSSSQWLHHEIDISDYDGQPVVVRFVNINGYGNNLYLDNVGITQSGLRLALRLMLEGPYEGTGKMRTDLRSAGLIPIVEPYTALGFTQAGDGGGETMLPTALANTGDNAIVDWVLVELRDAATPATIVATRPALLQRDGDVTDINGSSPVALLAATGSYKVAVRHRNHLGVMTNAASTLNTTTPVAIDLSSPGTAVYGTAARKEVNGVSLLWAGNALRDGQIKYTGGGNDRDPILLQVGSTTPNGTVSGYFPEDVNLNGQVKYTGNGNDRDPVLINVGSTTPNATRTQQLP